MLRLYTVLYNYDHPLWEQRLLRGEGLHTGSSVTADDSTANVSISRAAIRFLRTSASGLVSELWIIYFIHTTALLQPGLVTDSLERKVIDCSYTSHALM